LINVFEKTVELQNAGRDGVLVTVVEKEGSGPLPPGAKLLVYRDGRTVGTVGGGALELLATQTALKVQREQKSLLKRYALSEQNEIVEGEPTGMLCGGRVALFYEYLPANPRVYLFGGGHVGQGLVRHLRDLDFHVTLIDSRAGINEAGLEVDRVLIADYDRALSEEEVPEGGFFVIATHSHRFDYTLLRRVLTSGWKPRYVGVIASKKKASGFLRDLKAELGSDANLGTLYMPIGLDTGGSSAAEIAVSIAAEIQAVRYGRCGVPHLRLEGLEE
jgi:xanthine dehydrogenase accessory factor